MEETGDVYTSRDIMLFFKTNPSRDIMWKFIIYTVYNEKFFDILFWFCFKLRSSRYVDLYTFLRHRLVSPVISF